MISINHKYNTVQMDLNLLCEEYRVLVKIVPVNFQRRFLNGTLSAQNYIEECKKIFAKVIVCQKQIRIYLTRKRIIQKNKKKLLKAYWRTYSYNK